MEQKKTQRNAIDLPGLLVIFGGTGDLTNRKLIPAIYNLIRDGLLPEHFKVLAVGRKEKTTQEYLIGIKESIMKYSRNEIKEEIWNKIQSIVSYYKMDFTNLTQYETLLSHVEELEQKSKTKRNRIPKKNQRNQT